MRQAEVQESSSSPLAKFPEGANALIVGASGGIGGALASALEAHPRFARVLRTARVAAPGVHALDLSDDDSINAFARALEGEVEVLHLVIICAGLLHDEAAGMAPEKRLADLDRAALHRSYDVNAVGPALLAQALALLLPRREHAVWATLSARVGSIGDNRLGGWYAYRAAKAAQNMLTRTLAIELGRRHRGLACIALHPGTVATGLSAPFRRPDADGVFTAQTSAWYLLSTIDKVDASNSGRFYAFDGKEIPW